MTLNIFKIISKEIGWFALAILFAALILIPFDLIGWIDLNDESNALTTQMSQRKFLIILATQNLGFLICALWRRQREQERLDKWKNFNNKLPFIKKIGLGIALAFILLIAVHLQEIILYQFFAGPELAKSNWTGTSDFGLGEKIFLLIMGSIFVPIVEELYFREVMLGSIYRIGFPSFAMFFSCAVFGIIHFDFMHIFAYLIYGVGFSLVYIKTRSLIPSITAHILINLIGFSLILFT